MGTTAAILRPSLALAAGLSLVLLGTAGEGGPLRVLPYPTLFPGYNDSAAAAGDVDGDGTPDFLVGLPRGIDDFSGSVAVVVSGRDGSILRTLAGPGQPGDDFGAAVAVLGDIDGRGSREYLVAAPGGEMNFTDLPQPTYAMVFAGEDGAVLFDSGPRETEGYGRLVSALPDLDGDGTQEFAIGEGNPDYAVPGAVTIHSGGTGLPLHCFEAPPDTPGDVSVVPLADQDGDGLPDLAVGFTGPSGVWALEAGRVSIVSGATFVEIRSLPGRWRGVLYGPWILPFGTPENPSGSFLAVGGDLRRDTSVILRVDAGTGRVLFAVRPDDPYRFIANVHSLGDQDGDGVRDILSSVHSEHAHGGLDAAGRVQVHSGATGRLLFSRLGWGGGEYMLNQTLPAGDFDGDEREDIGRLMPEAGRIEIDAVDPAPCPESLIVALQRIPGSPDESGRGELEAWIDLPRLLFRVSVLLPNNQTSPAYVVWLEDGPGAGSFELVGYLWVDARNGRGRSHSGTGVFPVPVDPPCLASPAFVGRRVEIRDYFGTVFLAARIPSPAAGPSTARARLFPPDGAPFPKARATATVVGDPSRGSLRLSLRTGGLPACLAPEAWIEDAPGSGILESFGTLSGGRLVRDSTRGGHLPGGAPDAAALSGRGIEVRAGDVVLIAGTLP